MLDVGSGTGLLGMMAARAGADNVVGVEMDGSMCTIADEVIASNRLASKCTTVLSDARRLFTADSPGLREGRKPDGSMPELKRRADVMVFEVFDCGLIGEGAIHVSAIAAHRLLMPDAAIIPASARVFCQPIQFRLSTVCGVDVEVLNRYNWRPDYESLDMQSLKEHWTPLADPVQVFEITFADYAANAVPALRRKSVVCTASGTVNCILLWFDLDLDESERLSSSPYAAESTSWSQALYYVQEVMVREGDMLEMEVSHDTYAFSTRVRRSAAPRLSSSHRPHRLRTAAASRRAGYRCVTRHGRKGTTSW